MNSVKSTIAKNLSKNGFHKVSSNKYCRRINEIAVVICFEQPSDLLYVQFVIVPLFMPCEGHICFDYGGRLNSLFSDCPVLSKHSSKEEGILLSESIICHIEDDLLPFAHSLSTASSICSYLRKCSKPFGCSSRNYFQCTPEQTQRLHMYSCLKAGEYLEAMNVAKKYTKTVEKCSYYVPEIKKRKTREGEAIVEMIEGGQVQRIDTVLTQNLYDNLKMLNLSTTIEDNHDQNSSKATGRHWKYFE